MLALIDGDICVHRVGFTTENDEFQIAKYRIDEMLDGILTDTGATAYRVYLSDITENGFRRAIYPEYKRNRIIPKPKHNDALKEYLLTSEWKARIAMEQEADDALGIDQIYVHPDVLSNDKRSVICSIDKDLLQIPGLHWNFVKKEWHDISKEEGLRRFYYQLLTGDTSDNVRGVVGIGPVKAARLLGPYHSEEDFFLVALRTYTEWLCREWQLTEKELTPLRRKEIYDMILVTGQVLKVRQQEDEIWTFPKAFQNLLPSSEPQS